MPQRTDKELNDHLEMIVKKVNGAICVTIGYQVSKLLGELKYYANEVITDNSSKELKRFALCKEYINELCQAFEKSDDTLTPMIMELCDKIVPGHNG